MVKKVRNKDIINLPDTSSFKHTSIFYATNREDEAAGNLLLRFLLLKKAKINYKDGINQTALFYACRHGHKN
jgi:ankyrin repeat protein